MGKCRIYVVFSKEGADVVNNGDVDDMIDFLDACPYEVNDCVKIRDFETEGERDAYLKALDDFEGFMDFATLSPSSSFDRELIHEIDKRYA